MSTTKYECTGQAGMVHRIIGGKYMLRTGDVVELTEAEVKSESVKSAIFHGELTEVAAPAAAPVVEPEVVKPVPKAKAAKPAEAPAPAAE